jgi:Tol biopolymer transport system component
MRPTVLPPRRLGVFVLVCSALLAGLISTTRASSTGSAPAAPDLVFQSDRDGNLEIYAMRSDGHLQRRLTVEPGVDRDPTVSPSGLVAFASDRGGELDLYVMNSEGRAVTRLTSLPGAETQPAFSPDGSKLAFVHGGDVFVMDANGSRVRNITHHPAADADPSWSPDGRRLAFSSERAGSQEIFVTRIGGRKAVALTHSSGNSAPDWSPDGSRIAFTHRDDIQLVSVRSRSETTVATGLSDPVFSPDGAGLAAGNGKDVILVSLANGSRVNLSFSAALDSAPDWRAPGTQERAR